MYEYENDGNKKDVDLVQIKCICIEERIGIVLGGNVQMQAGEALRKLNNLRRLNDYCWHA